MRKIGLVTFYASNNYGTCLQAFAIQKKIQLLGYDCKIIIKDHHSNDAKISFIKRLITLCNKFGILGIIHRFKAKNKIQTKNKDFATFRDNYLSFAQYKNDVNQFDCFVCGSDMMWSSEFFDQIDFYGLSFVKPSRKIAYAPSFGSPQIPDEMKKKYKKILSDFNWLSCRESSGVKLIKQLTGKDVSSVADPTMLFTKEEWNKMFNLHRENKDKYILVYLFSVKDKSIRNYIKQIQNITNYQVIYIPVEYKDFNMNALDDYGPIGFLSLYYNAEYIIADGFHGLLFSLIFEKPFSLIHRDKKEHWGLYEDRMMSTLKDLELESRYIYSDEQFDHSMLNLDYTEIQELIEKKRKLSEDYLKNSLEECLNAKNS